MDTTKISIIIIIILQIYQKYFFRFDYLRSSNILIRLFSYFSIHLIHSKLNIRLQQTKSCMKWWFHISFMDKKFLKISLSPIKPELNFAYCYLAYYLSACSGVALVIFCKYQAYKFNNSSLLNIKYFPDLIKLIISFEFVLYNFWLLFSCFLHLISHLSF